VVDEHGRQVGRVSAKQILAALARHSAADARTPEAA
jgi:hypothetical protein